MWRKEEGGGNKRGMEKGRRGGGGMGETFFSAPSSTPFSIVMSCQPPHTLALCTVCTPRAHVSS